VTLDERVGDLYIVTKGLKPGERVIVEGMQKVRPGMQVKVQQKSSTEAAPATPPAGQLEKAPAAPPAGKTKTGG
jgi:membrane fusion protein (multidrug efflux system)